MKTLIAITVLFLAIHCIPLAASEQAEAPVWAEQFAERLGSNQTYLAEMEEYYDLDNAKEAAEYERSKRTQEQLLTFITLLQKSNDHHLQAQFLKFEYLWELENAFFDMEYAEDMAERLTITGKIVTYTNHLRTIEAWLTAQAEAKKSDDAEQAADSE